MRIRFYLDSKQGKDGDSPITVSIAPKGCRFYTSTGYRISQGKRLFPKREQLDACSKERTGTEASTSFVLGNVRELEQGMPGRGRKGFRMQAHMIAPK